MGKEFLQVAVEPAQATQVQFGVPASVTIAQAILESGWGASHMGDANNYFGIKAMKTGDTVEYGPIASGWVVAKTREVKPSGEEYYIDDYFRRYASIEDSFRDHGRLLALNYPDCMSHRDDPMAFADALQSGTPRYATDPNYAATLRQIITENKLTQYDVQDLGGEEAPPEQATPDPQGEAPDDQDSADDATLPDDDASSTDDGGSSVGTGDDSE